MRKSNRIILPQKGCDTKAELFNPKSVVLNLFHKRFVKDPFISHFPQHFHS
jgi:hypothetical protein